MKRLVVLTCVVGTLLALLVGCSTTVLEVRESYLPMEPGRPYKMSYRRSGEVCGGRAPGASWVADAIAKMTQNSDRVDNVIGLHVEMRTKGLSQCVAVSGYPIIYVDNQPKRGVFARRMMYGAGAGAAPSTPMRETPPVIGSAPTYAPTPAPTVAPAPTPAPIPKPKNATPSKAECESKCARFAGIWKGSAAIQGTIRRNCVQKCVKPDKKAYRDCIDGAGSIEDIGKCNNL